MQHTQKAKITGDIENRFRKRKMFLINAKQITKKCKQNKYKYVQKVYKTQSIKVIIVLDFLTM